MPPVTAGRDRVRTARRLVTRLFLPLAVLVLATYRAAPEWTLPAHQAGLILTALALAFVDAVRHVVRAERDERAAGTVLRDELTGAWSRRGLEQQFAVRRTGATAGTVLLLDLDGFKAVNDQHGHAAGDEVLRQTVFRIADVVRTRGLVARLGGDEFVVLLDGPEGDLPMRLSVAIAVPVSWGGGFCRVTTSIGVVPVPDWSIGGSAILAEADRRMYRRKRDRPSTLRPASPGVRSSRAW